MEGSHTLGACWPCTWKVTLRVAGEKGGCSRPAMRLELGTRALTPISTQQLVPTGSAPPLGWGAYTQALQAALPSHRAQQALWPDTMAPRGYSGTREKDPVTSAP